MPWQLKSDDNRFTIRIFNVLFFRKIFRNEFYLSSEVQRCYHRRAFVNCLLEYFIIGSSICWCQKTKMQRRLHECYNCCVTRANSEIDPCIWIGHSKSSDKAKFITFYTVFQDSYTICTISSTYILNWHFWHLPWYDIDNRSYIFWKMTLWLPVLCFVERTTL